MSKIRLHHALLTAAATLSACQDSNYSTGPLGPAATDVVASDFGSKIAFTRLKETPESNEFEEDEIWVMNVDGSDARRLTHNTTFDIGAEWSPDGHTIAFYSAQFAGTVQISPPFVSLINADGSDERKLPGACGRFPSWSNNGKRIAFDTGNRCPSPNEIFVINTDGSGLTNLTNHPALDTRAAFSPNGQLIAFNSNRDGNGEIYVMNADGSNVVRLTFNAGTDQAPAWSPDGQKIVFQSDRDDPLSDLYVMNADGTDVKRLTFGGGRDIDPCWSPDGRQIVFDSDRAFVAEGIRQVFIMNADGTDQRALTALPSENGHAGWGRGRIVFPQ